MQDYVDRYFPDVLLKDVLKHDGRNTRPNGELGESTLCQERGTSGRETMTAALESAALDPHERKALAEDVTAHEKSPSLA